MRHWRVGERGGRGDEHVRKNTLQGNRERIQLKGQAQEQTEFLKLSGFLPCHSRCELFQRRGGDFFQVRNQFLFHTVLY